MNSEKIKSLRSASNARMFLLFLGIMLAVNAVVSTGRYGLTWMQMSRLSAEVELEKEQGNQENPGDSMPEALTEAADAQLLEEASEAVTEVQTSAAQDEASTEPDVKEIIAQLEEAGITSGILRVLGILSLVVAVAELITGMICAIFSNRVDKSKITFIAAASLMCLEIIYVVYLFSKRALMLSSLIYSIIMPGILVWSAWKMRKLAKEDPERIYAVAQGRTAYTPRKGKKDDNAPGSAGTVNASSSAAPSGSGQPSGKKSLKERASMKAKDEP